MRILSPQVGLSQNSGGGRYDFEMLAALARRGEEVLVMLPRHTRGRYPLPAGCTLLWSWARWGLDPRLANPAYFFPLLSAAIRWRPDVLRVHSINALGPASALVGRLLGIPVVAHFHHRFETRGGLDRAELALARGRYDHVITDSQASRQQLLEMSPDLEARCSTVYPGVAPTFRAPAGGASDWRSAHGLPAGRPLFVTVGALIPRKNVAFLLDVVAAWAAQGRPGLLVIAGDGEERPKLERMIADRGLTGRVQIWGHIPEDEKVSLLQAADAFLFPSLMEGFGFAPAEALACGTPALVSDRGALPEVVRDGSTGFVLPLDRGCDPWLEAMQALAGDRALRDRLARQGIEDVRQRFNWDRAADQVCEIYQGVCKRPGKETRVA